ncbi:E3 ubiquitin-protein ligase NEDD4 [Platysternon megacephalum]|uniref:E3 ubiquitin-protein ligase NEDD4 n=1 Tax=Platysternon megacephalum TaxID=55544 RepID=A0A4D9E4T6_9SAUR|nr:E3 ubiquitin-protein ligase NEDD4 [Platysternon megacephalum]
MLMSIPNTSFMRKAFRKGMHLAKSPQSGCLLLFLFDPESDIMLLNFSHHNHFPAVKIITSVQDFRAQRSFGLTVLYLV